MTKLPARSTHCSAHLAGKVAIVICISKGIGAALAESSHDKVIRISAPHISTNRDLAQKTLIKTESVSPSLRTAAICANASDLYFAKAVVSGTLQNIGASQIGIPVPEAAMLGKLGQRYMADLA